MFFLEIVFGICLPIDQEDSFVFYTVRDPAICAISPYLWSILPKKMKREHLVAVFSYAVSTLRACKK
jgi:hypothetical protein